MRRAAALAAAVLAVLAGSTQAQTIYRCGPQGREYSQQPCKDARPIEADTRTPEQVKAAQKVAAADARRAEALRRERLARERAALPAAGFKTAPLEDAPAPKKKPAPNKKKTEKSDTGR